MWSFWRPHLLKSSCLTFFSFYPPGGHLGRYAKCSLGFFFFPFLSFFFSRFLILLFLDIERSLASFGPRNDQRAFVCPIHFPRLFCSRLFFLFATPLCPPSDPCVSFPLQSVLRLGIYTFGCAVLTEGDCRPLRAPSLFEFSPNPVPRPANLFFPSSLMIFPSGHCVSPFSEPHSTYSSVTPLPSRFC